MKSTSIWVKFSLKIEQGHGLLTDNNKNEKSLAGPCQWARHSSSSKVSRMAAAAQASTKFEIAGKWVEAKSTKFQVGTDYQFTCALLNLTASFSTDFDVFCRSKVLWMTFVAMLFLKGQLNLSGRCCHNVGVNQQTPTCWSNQQVGVDWIDTLVSIKWLLTRKIIYTQFYRY